MIRKFCWCFCALLFVRSAGAQEDRLRLNDLLQEALSSNPEVQTARKRWEAARQRPDQASSLPETVLSLGYSSSGSPRPLAGLGVEPTTNAGFMVTQEFPFPGKRQLRGDIARKEADAVYQKLLQAELSVVARIKVAYHKLHHAYEVGDLLENHKQMLRRYITVAEGRYAAGKAEQQEILRAQTELSITETKIERQLLDLRLRENEIQVLLNRPRAEKLPRTVEITSGEFHLDLDALIASARDQSPMLLEEEKNIQREELSMNLARKDIYPDYSVSAGYYNMGRMPDMYQVRVDFKLPTSWFRKQRAMVNEKAIEVTAARKSYQSANQRVVGEIREAYLMAQSANRLMTLYATTIGPQSSMTLESSLASYEAGKADFLGVISNQIALLQAEEEYHMQMLEFHLALVRLEELTGLKLIDEAVL